MLLDGRFAVRRERHRPHPSVIPYINIVSEQPKQCRREVGLDLAEHHRHVRAAVTCVIQRECVNPVATRKAA